MANFLYQFHHGHVVANVGGRPCLLNTGAQFSVGYEPIRIGEREFPVDLCYMGITSSYLAEHIGTTIDAMIGADIIAEYTLGVYAAERVVQFSALPPIGTIMLPLSDYSGLPVLNVWVNGRVRRMFLDTGAPTSMLLPDALAGLTPENRFEDFYPLLGNFLTPIHFLDVQIGSHRRAMRFGEVPEEMTALFTCAGVQGLIGSELLRYFDLNLSMRDSTLRLEPPMDRLGVA